MIAKLKEMEYSKKIIIFSDIIAVLNTLFVCYFIKASLSVDYLPYLITLASLWITEATVAHGFYYWKSRTENKFKWIKGLTKEEKEGISINISMNIDKDS